MKKRQKQRQRRDLQRRPSTHRTPPDGGAHGIKNVKGELKPKYKTYPNGIMVTFGALWQYWWLHARPDALPDAADRETSAKQFSEIFDLPSLAAKLKSKYPGLNPPIDMKRSGEAFQEIGNGSTVELDYFSIRWAAELVDLPVGLFVMFTHLISKERRLTKKLEAGEISVDKKKAVMLSLADQIEAFAIEAKRLIESSSDVDQIFYEEFDPEVVRPAGKHEPDGSEAHYLARLEALKFLVDAVRKVEEK